MPTPGHASDVQTSIFSRVGTFERPARRPSQARPAETPLGDSNRRGAREYWNPNVQPDRKDFFYAGRVNIA